MLANNFFWQKLFYFCLNIPSKFLCDWYYWLGEMQRPFCWFSGLFLVNMETPATHMSHKHTSHVSLVSIWISLPTAPFGKPSYTSKLVFIVYHLFSTSINSKGKLPMYHRLFMSYKCSLFRIIASTEPLNFL